jgi:hypothetical protein
VHYSGGLFRRLRRDCRTSFIRNDLHIAEFLEPIFAEFNANPLILMSAEWNVGMDIEVLIDPDRPGIKLTCNGVQ